MHHRPILCVSGICTKPVLVPSLYFGVRWGCLKYTAMYVRQTRGLCTWASDEGASNTQSVLCRRVGCRDLGQRLTSRLLPRTPTASVGLRHSSSLEEECRKARVGVCLQQCVCRQVNFVVCSWEGERERDWLITVYFSTVKILAQRPTHIFAVATVLLITKTFTVK